MKHNEKITIGIWALTVSIFFGIPISAQVFKCKVRNSVKPYIEANLEKIISAQEKKLGIKHFGKPDIIFDKDADDFCGLYLRKYDLICINPNVLITPEDNFSNNLFRFLGNQNPDVKEILDHELGHFYADKLSESLGYGDWPPLYLKHMSLSKILCFKLISEGIAEYFERKMNDGQDNFKDSDWPEKKEYFCDVKLLYDGGYHLVKPIIDKHGKAGIEYLMANPPAVEDLKQLPEYQSRVLEDLSK